MASPLRGKKPVGSIGDYIALKHSQYWRFNPDVATPTSTALVSRIVINRSQYSCKKSDSGLVPRQICFCAAAGRQKHVQCAVISIRPVRFPSFNQTQTNKHQISLIRASMNLWLLQSPIVQPKWQPTMLRRALSWVKSVQHRAEGP